MLICIADYRGTINPYTEEQGEIRAGAEVHVTPDIEEFLLRAGPGSFHRQVEGEEAPVIEKAPDRQQRGGRRR